MATRPPSTISTEVVGDYGVENSCSAPGGCNAFYWDGVLHDLGRLGDRDSHAVDLNTRGQIVGREPNAGRPGSPRNARRVVDGEVLRDSFSPHSAGIQACGCQRAAIRTHTIVDQDDPLAVALRGFGPLGILAIVVIVAGNLIVAPLSAVLVLAWVRGRARRGARSGTCVPRAGSATSSSVSPSASCSSS